jgi:peptide/nickel transport system substrate-binding protein
VDFPDICAILAAAFLRDSGAWMRTPLLALALAATLCAPWAATAKTPANTIVIAQPIDDIISLDPAEEFELTSEQENANTYDRLLAYDLQDVSKITGVLAESWSVGADGKTYSFKLRQGLKFASGNPITAADAAWSLQRVVILNKTPAFIITQLGFTADNVRDRIRATDASTLVIETGEAYAPSFVYYLLTATVASVVDAKLAQEHEKDGDFGNGWLRLNSGGSGPYVLKSWKPRESLLLEANPNYWGEAPKTPRIFIRHVQEAATARLLLESGDADYARSLGRDQIEALAKNPEIRIQTAPKGNLVYLSFNQANPALKHPEVREALRYLIDYDGIRTALLGQGYTTHQTFLPNGFLGAVDDTPFHFDLDKAKDLLKQAGLADGFSVTIDVPNVAPYPDIAQAIQASWAQAGIKLTLNQLDLKQIYTRYRAREQDIFFYFWGPDYQDPHTNAQAFAENPDNGPNTRTKTVAWRSNWDIPELSARVEAAVRETDTAKRAALYEALQRDILHSSSYAFLYQTTEVVAHRAEVDGLVLGPSIDTDFWAGIVKK